MMAWSFRCCVMKVRRLSSLGEGLQFFGRTPLEASEPVVECFWVGMKGCGCGFDATLHAGHHNVITVEPSVFELSYHIVAFDDSNTYFPRFSFEPSPCAGRHRDKSFSSSGVAERLVDL